MGVEWIGQQGQHARSWVSLQERRATGQRFRCRERQGAPGCALLGTGEPDLRERGYRRRSSRGASAGGRVLRPGCEPAPPDWPQRGHTHSQAAARPFVPRTRTGRLSWRGRVIRCHRCAVRIPLSPRYSSALVVVWRHTSRHTRGGPRGSNKAAAQGIVARYSVGMGLC